MKFVERSAIVGNLVLTLKVVGRLVVARYTSMLLATTQTQQRQIESLQEQVEELGHALERLSRLRPRAR